MKRCFAVIATIICVFEVFASAPQLMNYQGQLKNENGEPRGGSVALSFSIYGSEAATTGESPIWGPQTFQDVALVDGFFNVILGPVDDNDLPIARAFDDSVRYIEISEGENAISPRQRILSTPYSLRTADVPAGAIMAFALDSCPSGWAEWEAGKGRFLRGIDNRDEATSVDPDGERQHSSLQEDALASHAHDVYTGIPDSSRSLHGSIPINGYSLPGSTKHNGSSTETRPKNVAVWFCIKE